LNSVDDVGPGKVLKVEAGAGHVVRIELELLCARHGGHPAVLLLVAKVLLDNVKRFVVDVAVFVRLQILNLVQTCSKDCGFSM